MIKWHFITLVRTAEAIWIRARNATARVKLPREKGSSWKAQELIPSQGRCPLTGVERNQKMKLKLLISAGMVLGLFALSITAFGNSFADEPEDTTEAVIEAETISETITPAEAEPTETELPTYQSMIYSRDWDAEESYLLAKIAMAEEEDQDTEGKADVILVVLNRVWSDKFPDSIEEVIYQKNQFSPVSNGRFDKVEPDEDCWGALLMVEHGWDESQGALYFESESASTWHRNHLQFLFQHGDHMFYTDKE